MKCVLSHERRKIERVLKKILWPFKEEVKHGGRNSHNEVKLLTIHT